MSIAAPQPDSTCVNPRSREGNEARLLIVGRGLRAFVDGYVAILLPAYLLTLGLSIWQVGLLSTATLLGSALATVAVGTWGHRFHHRRLLLAAALLMAATGLSFAGLAAFWPLLAVAFVGTLNPGSGDVSVFLPLEHARLAEAAQGNARTTLFARYSLTASFCAALGALATAAPDGLARLGVDHLAALRIMFVVYGAAGVVDLDAVPATADAIRSAAARCHRRPSGLRAALWCDWPRCFRSTRSREAWWCSRCWRCGCSRRFDLSLAAAGAFFFWAGLLTATSQLVAPWVARRIGLLNTMVFTHIPSSMALIAAAFASQYRSGAGTAAAARRTVADGRTDPLRFRHGGGYAAGAVGGCQLTLRCRAASPRR